MFRAKFLALIVILSMILAACTPAATPTAAPTEKPKAEPTAVPAELPKKGLACAPKCEYKDLVVGFLQTGSEGGWRAANTASFKETAEQLGLTLKFYDSQNDLAKEVAGFQQFIQDPQVNVIVLSALETTGWEQVLKDAAAAGKIVVIQDRRIDAPDTLFETYIGADFVEEGRKSADEICALLKNSAKKNVWELVGNVGSSAAKDRGQGFREKMADCGITITNSQTANWSITEGKQVTEAWLKESKDVQAIFAQNDEMGLGAIEALKEAGLKPGVDVYVLSVDATAGAFKAMLAGTLNVTVECNPLLAPQVYEAALKAANGETLPKWVASQEGVFRATDPNLKQIADGRKY
ncbi:MAG TPA: ABC transporter substrate-binding protein [Anaerolineaceae bacterium]|nr:ABC transporter substrate-binding protein [Anaerolineaceae bacterium]HPN50323.1 ABC transporter substrate-binding protein [Anaerolineaceae bacterium]